MTPPVQVEFKLAYSDSTVQCFNPYTTMTPPPRLEFEHDYSDSTVQRFNHYTTMTPPARLEFELAYYEANVSPFSHFAIDTPFNLSWVISFCNQFVIWFLLGFSTCVLQIPFLFPLYCPHTSASSHKSKIYIFTNPSRWGRIWHNVNF